MSLESARERPDQPQASGEMSLAQLPRGTRLLHIGPPKTGTSALQGSCHAGRDALRKAGVRYAGSGVQPSTAAFAITEREHPSTGRPPSMRHWNSLVREVKSARGDSVLISSEFFAGATPVQAERIINELGRERTHVAITLRPLTKILASRWQQNVQEGAKIQYDEWLREVLTNPASTHARRFWSRQRHDELVERWVSVAGADRVHVIVIDDRDHDEILRQFETLLGAPANTLVAHKDAPNRSLTLEEVEVVRSFNEQFAEAGLSTALRHKLMARGAATHLKRREPEPSEQKILTPGWAISAAHDIALEMIERISKSGADIRGDLSLLATLPIAGTEERDPETTVHPEIAARAAMGILFSSGATHGYEEGSRVPAWGEPYDLQRLSSRQLAIVLLQRLLSRLMRIIRSPRTPRT